MLQREVNFVIVQIIVLSPYQYQWNINSEN